MEQTNAQAVNPKKKKLLLAAACLVLVAVAVLLLLTGSGAWLADRGQWTDSRYTIAQIDYTYTINDKLIDTQPQKLIATVPIIGGVKINDSASVPTTDPGYEKYAAQNFNEGITVAHIVVENKSKFDFNGSYSMTFEDMFETGKDIFYLVLPKGAQVDTKAKTVDGVAYKEYILQNALTNHTDFSAMQTSLSQYYADNPKLMGDKFHLQSKDVTDGSNRLVVDVLFWSEYSDDLPFVSDGSLQPANPEANLIGKFAFDIHVNQNEEQ